MHLKVFVMLQIGYSIQKRSKRQILDEYILIKTLH